MATVQKPPAPASPRRSRTTPIWATSTARPNCSMAPAISFGLRASAGRLWWGYKDPS